MWVIREFQMQDLAACQTVIESNTPTYFAAHEPAEFMADLSQRATLPAARQWPYFVLETAGVILACGGYYLDKDNHGTLLWGMVHRDHHRKGLGQALLAHRLRYLQGVTDAVLIDTTPRAFGFYEKAGFVQTGFEKNGYELGLDKVYARYTLS